MNVLHLVFLRKHDRTWLLNNLFVEYVRSEILSLLKSINIIDLHD